jgi:hypothetical protein
MILVRQEIHTPFSWPFQFRFFMFCLEKGFNHLCDVTITDFTIRMGVGLKK